MSSKKILTPWTGPEHKDHNLQPSYWHNQDVRQIHYFKSFIHSKYPDYIEHYEKIAAKPGRVTLIPHRYYVINTRDGTPARGAWVHGEFVEEAAPASLSRGDALGHED